MNFDMSEEQRMILAYGDNVAKKYDRTYWMQCAAENRSPRELFDQIAKDGFIGMMVDEEYGGAGLGMMELALLMEGLASNGIPLLSLVVGSGMAMPLLNKHGSEEIKSRLLPDACSGKTKLCFAITEPDAGSNTIKITTTAKAQGDGTYRLNGQKYFISDADDSDYVLLVTRTTPMGETKKKTDGFTLFMVDLKAKGIDMTRIDMSIPVPENQMTLFFDDVVLTDGDIVGEKDKGFQILFDCLNPERILVGAVSTGLGRYALGKAVEYANDRVVFKGPIGAYQGLQHPLAQAKTEIEMSSLMTYKAAWMFDQGRPAGEYSSYVKYFSAEAACHAVDSSLQCFGGNGFTKEYGIFDIYPMTRLLRTAPLNREMVLNYIGQNVLGLPRSY
ncbi:MAG: acyl-CoA/acyl-ACP dehydrogenase [Pseudomonadales bacterium]|nr:acyl-CoA/acyl-ACP dehydrogenase [Pseudomonadales bacterium]